MKKKNGKKRKCLTTEKINEAKTQFVLFLQ